MMERMQEDDTVQLSSTQEPDAQMERLSTASSTTATATATVTQSWSPIKWLLLRGRDVVAPLVLNPFVPYTPRLPPPDDMPSRGCVSVRHHFLPNHQPEKEEDEVGVEEEEAQRSDRDEVSVDDGEKEVEDDGSVDEGEAGSRIPPSTAGARIRVVSLNMEMGKRMADIVADMKRLRPDVLLLQEVDLCCPRSGNVDCAGEIAQELGMACVFACEVENPSKFPGEAAVFEAGGRQGNAILSRFPVKDAWPVLVTCRKSRHHHTAYKTHTEAAAVLETPHGDLLCYSLHLDPHYAGVEGRIAQYFEVLDDMRQYYAPGYRRGLHADEVASSTTTTTNESDDARNEKRRAQYALIAGDFNTVTTGVARLAPTLGWTRSSWWTTLGWTEAEWFDLHGVKRGNEEKGLDLADPFDKRTDSTFDRLQGLYRAKLDWCLLSSNMSVVHHEVGPSGSCSDHNWICVDVTME